MWLEPEIFKTVVKHTPLVSIDLIVRDASERVLLGMRTNRPARDSWFVPGGRIDKDEAIEAAFSRLVKDELGVLSSFHEARFLGVYQHFYDDNFSGTEFSTHYVVLAYELHLDLALDDLPCEQHSLYCWLDVDELLAADEVHQNTKAYFIEETLE